MQKNENNVRAGLFLLLVLALVSLAGAGLGWQIRQTAVVSLAQPEVVPVKDILRATYDPIHFRPAIESATDAQCLACHREVLDDTVRETSPAGIPSANSRAWYQQLSTYSGAQDTFHRRHLVTPMAKSLMKLSCTTCHQGSDPREEAQGSSATGTPQSDDGFTLRKQVNVEQVCLMCHGQMNTEIMGLPGPWHESGELFGNNCLTCHASIRTTRHQVNFLNAEAIEKAGAENGDSCYGCHGGRAWYRLSYPYPRHAWAGMSSEVPDWAVGRPTESAARFSLTASQRTTPPSKE